MDNERLITLLVGFAIGWVGIKLWRHFRRRR
ncbi:hypothetical protein MSR1_24070 [Magnetospirillum gryphiswaldense MSR-1]|nr:hypothetical protein MSR1_24070 [Magnetospirillum gryphiswaldense MSR-1]AVM78791.1 hypothetical protein MSR1L_24070 [Magnetospirillum gryphiswaldense]